MNRVGSLISRFLKKHKSQPSVDEWLNVAYQLHTEGKQEEAQSYYEKILAVNPVHIDANYYLGELFRQQGQYASALKYLNQALESGPLLPPIHFARALTLTAMGRPAEAIGAYKRLLPLDQSNLEAFNNLGILLQQENCLEDAVNCFVQALQLSPDFGPALFNLGVTFKKLNRLADAVHCLESVARLFPERADGHAILGHTLMEMRRFDEAIRAYDLARAIDPAQPEIYANLAFIAQERAEVDRAVSLCRKAAAIDPDFAIYQHNLLFCLNYHPDLRADEIFAEYAKWNEFNAQRFGAHRARHENSRNPDRKLRIGYVSPDFFSHASSLFFEPLLSCRDRSGFEVFCYAEVAQPDEVTARLRASSDHWMCTVGLSDDELAVRISKDGIDILIDLAGHERGNRLLVFARKPAPVQITWLGFGYTTGLKTMDYFIADPKFVPEDADAYFSEEVWRLPRPMFSYKPPPDMPETSSLPARKRGYVTFGSLSRAIRYNERTVAAWAQVLQAVPGSKLLLNTMAFDQVSTKEAFWRRFEERGIARERIELTYTCEKQQTWASYGDMDIALDPFPHNAGTTTFEALWMGVPVISMLDRPPMGRFGITLLEPLGLEGWVVRSVEEYVTMARHWANHLDELACLRYGLRDRMKRSAFLDEAGFVSAMEQAYRQMWQRWCNGGMAS